LHDCGEVAQRAAKHAIADNGAVAVDIHEELIGAIRAALQEIGASTPLAVKGLWQLRGQLVRR
jgi:hypothetical protein